MATVRFSEELRATILKNAGGLYVVRETAALAKRPVNVVERVYDLVMAPYAADIAKLPAEFFRRASVIIISTVADAAIPTPLESAKVEDHYITPSEFPAGSHVTRDAVSSYYSHNQWKLENTPDTAPIIDEIRIWAEGVYKVREERDKFVEGVKSVIAAYETLGPAIKAWPALIDLLPRQARAKHELVVERKKRDEVVIETDLNVLTGAVARSKLGGM